MVKSTSLGSSSTIKIRPSESIVLVSAVDSVPGNREKECCAFINFALGPNFASVTVDNPLDSGESDACAFEGLGLMQSLKNAKQLVGILHIKAGAVVFHE